jgi:hypothetical protein
MLTTLRQTFIVKVGSWKCILKILKLDYFGNEQRIHEMFDFLVVDSKGQYGFFHGHRSFFLGCKHDFKK